MGIISGSDPPTAAAIADAVWDELTADHVTASTSGLTQRQLRDAAISGSTASSVMGMLSGMTSGQSVATTSGGITGAFEAAGLKSTLTSTAAGAKGTYVQLIASTARIYSYLLVEIDSPQTAGFNYEIDIATGAAASEVVLIPDIHLKAETLAGGESMAVLIPCNIAASTRIAARTGNDSGAQKTIVLSVIGIG